VEKRALVLRAVEGAGPLLSTLEPAAVSLWRVKGAGPLLSILGLLFFWEVLEIE